MKEKKRTRSNCRKEEEDDDVTKSDNWELGAVEEGRRGSLVAEGVVTGTI